MEEIILNHIRWLFDSGKLEPGDRLPAERKLAEQLGVSRAHVRSAYQKLEFYGIAKTYPQSGTIMTEKATDVIASLLLIITPDVLAYYRKHDICATPSARVEEEHQQIFEAIVARDAARATKIVNQHLKGITAFAKKQLKK